MPTAPRTFRMMPRPKPIEKQWASRKSGNHALYNLPQWRRNGMRGQYLRENPLCVECGEVATEVDHIVPHCGDMELFLDWENLQALCKSCHSRKTMREQKNK